MDLKADHLAHEARVEAQLKQMNRTIEDAGFKQKNFEQKVETFKSVLDKFDQSLAVLEAQHKTAVNEAQEQTKKVYNELNTRILDVAKRQNNIEINWTTLESNITQLQSKSDSLTSR